MTQNTPTTPLPNYDRYYGDGTTIHHTGHLDVEVHDGKVIAVWFRCQMLPFKQCDITEDRAIGLDTARGRLQDDGHLLPAITGLMLQDVS